jgi:hypothetical protein
MFEGNQILKNNPSLPIPIPMFSFPNDKLAQNRNKTKKAVFFIHHLVEIIYQAKSIQIQFSKRVSH